MNSPNVLKIENDLRVLSLEELEWLLERITIQLQEKKQISDNFTAVKYMKDQLATMANDLDMQLEIAAINNELGL
ncbi:hypothetical protein A6769_18925 [Nostoc punctiforme NIES-2108]|uniref:Uncharacterized protein n=1 Tax=Nostoc punctiforme NIES-2108 TaxID=1356359 RepID=A0A367RGP4_NOSPU|nr:hypothetical protein A6769_18925 [Nostoc punctiforme NIES-2108]